MEEGVEWIVAREVCREGLQGRSAERVCKRSLIVRGCSRMDQRIGGKEALYRGSAKRFQQQEVS